MKYIIFCTLVTINLMANGTRNKKYVYKYVEREHTTKETLAHLGIVYAASWPLYYLTQPNTFKNEGSFSRYKSNFGRVVFDKDEPFWNWMVHPYSGSQLYLYYRAQGYTQLDSIKLTFASSTMFEFFVETYTEPASFQDLYQTPILGSLLGLTIEKFSLYMLNSGNPAYKTIAHILNPFTLFWFYEGKIKVVPMTTGKVHSALLSWEFP